MSRPAFRPSRARTTDCPTCGETKYHPCIRLSGDGLDRGMTVSVHAARRRVEAMHAWAMTVDRLALARLAEDMPDVRAARKPAIVDWLVSHEPDLLAESYRLTTGDAP